MEEEESTLTINKEYAAKYIKKKEHEERSIRECYHSSHTGS